MGQSSEQSFLLERIKENSVTKIADELYNIGLGVVAEPEAKIEVQNLKN